MNHNKYIALLSVLALVSCTDRTEEPDIAEGLAISFSYSQGSAHGSRANNDALPPQEIMLMPEEGPDTTGIKTYITVSDISRPTDPDSRGVPFDEKTDRITGFVAFSHFHPGGDATPQVFFTNKTVTETGTNTYATTNSYFWPTGDGKLSFHALVGMSDAVKVTASENAGNFDIEYTVPTDATKQNDLLLAKTAPLNTPGQKVPLSFEHLCSQVTFVIGKEMQQGTIRRITLSGINSHGVYSSSWTGVGSPKSFTINTNKNTAGNETAGTAIVGAEYTMMMLPQTLGENAELTVVFSDKITQKEYTFKASLAGTSWPQSKKTTYYIGITPQYEISLESPILVQDATYEICEATIRVNNLPANEPWTVSIKATENGSDENPSVQLQADANQFVKDGFWTDKLMTNGTTVDKNSTARGYETYSGHGSGSFPIYIFLPENAGENLRKYELKISLDNYSNEKPITETITQLAPAWNGDTGWEQIDDEEEGIFGFNYTSTKVYVYKWSETSNTADNIITQVKGIITQYKADDYTTIGKYYQDRFFLVNRYRNYVQIDYRKFKNMGENAQSPDKGQQNTKEMFNYGGPAITKNFEKAITDMKYRLNNSEPAYRLRVPEGTSGNDPEPPEGPPYAITGDQIEKSQILTMALKKNRYYLNTSTDGDYSTTTALIKAEDIVWYIPAYDQFNGVPTWNDGSSMIPGDFWSSTAINSTDNDTAYDGAKTPTDRGILKKLRVARNRE